MHTPLLLKPLHRVLLDSAHAVLLGALLTWFVFGDGTGLEQAPGMFKLGFLVVVVVALDLLLLNSLPRNGNGQRLVKISNKHKLILEMVLGLTLGIWGVSSVYYRLGVMQNAMMEFKLGGNIFLSVVGFLWFLQNRSPDKEKFTPRIWK